MATVPGTMKRPAYAPLKVFPAPPPATTPGTTTPIAMPQGRRRKTVDAGTGRHFGQPGDPRRPISPACLGPEAATTAIPGRRPSHNDARRKGPAARRGLLVSEKGPRWRDAWLLFCLIPLATKKGRSHDRPAELRGVKGGAKAPPWRLLESRHLGHSGLLTVSPACSTCRSKGFQASPMTCL
jgi:hypothetical protein